MIRLGVAGCGWAGERHYEAIERSDRATPVAIAEADAGLRRRRMADWDVEEGYADYGRMIERADLDAVVIALPPSARGGGRRGRAGRTGRPLREPDRSHARRS